MRSCMILEHIRGLGGSIDGEDDGIDPQESHFLGDDKLRLTIVWMILCFIAASTRHYLVQEMVKALENIKSVEVSDKSDQGRVRMNKEEIFDMKRTKGKLGDDQVLEYMPALRMKMWYLERVEVGGKVMEGGTLVVIRRAPTGGCSGGCVEGAFGGEREGNVLDEAVGKMM